MNPPVIPDTSSPGFGRILAGFCLIAGWVLVHVVLFYLIFVSSFLLEIFLGIARSILFPGSSRDMVLDSDTSLWAQLLTIGLWLGGAAGVPLGLRVFWRSKGPVLKRLFWITLIAAVLLDVSALVALVKSALS